MNFLSWIGKRNKGKKLGKSDWLILVLLGVLLMVVAWPAGSDSGKKEENEDSGKASAAAESGGTGASANAGSDGEADGSGNAYIKKLEQELEDLLKSMSGVGDVKVMITLQDEGQIILDKDTSSSADSYSESTVILEQDDEELPFVTSQKYPRIEGVVVVAQGAGNAGVATEITETVMALFSVDAHKVKVLKMS